MVDDTRNFAVFFSYKKERACMTFGLVPFFLVDGIIFFEALKCFFKLSSVNLRLLKKHHLAKRADVQRSPNYKMGFFRFPQ